MQRIKWVVILETKSSCCMCTNLNKLHWARQIFCLVHMLHLEWLVPLNLKLKENEKKTFAFVAAVLYF